MKTRVITALIFGLVMSLFIIPGYWSAHFTVSLLIIIGILAAGEFEKAFKRIGISLNKYNLMLFNLSFLTGLIYIFFFDTNWTPVQSHTLFMEQQSLFVYNQKLITQLLILYVFAIIIMTLSSIFAPLFKQGPPGLRKGIINVAAGVYVSFPLFCGFLLLYAIPAGWYLFVLAIITPWVCDSAALYSGVLWGNRKLAPKISPNKTVAGFIGGIVGTVILYLLLYIFLLPKLFFIKITFMGFFLVLILAVVIAVLTQCGDLLASSIKRICNIKDFSNLMPGHGGIIDRFDSTFFTITAILTIALLVNIF